MYCVWAGKSRKQSFRNVSFSWYSMGMSDNRSEIDQDWDVKAAANKLLSEDYEEFRDDLEILYVRGNLSGRLQFAKKWPEAAAFVFGEELIDFDQNGVKDRARLAELEDAADEQQMGLSEIVTTLESESVHEGVLQFEYVQTVVHALGRPLSLLMYAPGIVERVPDAQPEPEEEEALLEPVATDHEPLYEEASVEEVMVEEAPPEEYVPPPVLEPNAAQPSSIISPVKASDIKAVMPQVMFLVMGPGISMIDPSVKGPVEASFDIKNEDIQERQRESVEVVSSETPPQIQASVDPVLKQYVFEDNMNSSLEHLLNPQTLPDENAQTLTFVPAKKDEGRP